MRANELLEKIEEILENFIIFYLIIFDLDNSQNRNYAQIKEFFNEYGEVIDIKLDSAFLLQTTANISIETISEVANNADISRFMITEIAKNKIRYKNIFSSDVPKPIGL